MKPDPLHPSTNTTTFTDSLPEPISHFFNLELFQISGASISPGTIIVFGTLLAVTLFLAKFISRVLISNLLKKFELTPGTRHIIERITQYFIIALGLLIDFQVIGIDLSGLAMIFGMLGIGIGLGLQDLTSNITAGMLLLFTHPIKIGDRVTIGDTEGDVTEINLRATTIQSLNNISYIVPNSDFISSTVINWSHSDSKIRLDICVGVSYNSDVEKVRQALLSVAKSEPKVLAHPTPSVLLRNFGDSAWDMELRVWIQNPKEYQEIQSNINFAIVATFREQQIEIPFPQRDIHIHNNNNAVQQKITKQSHQEN